MKRKLATTEIQLGPNGRSRDRQLRGEIRTIRLLIGFLETLIEVRRQEQARLRRRGNEKHKKKGRSK